MSAPSILASHRYYMSPDYSEGRGFVEMPPPPWHKSLHAEMRYAYDVLEQALPIVEARGLTFYFTKDPYSLPEYGPHVVSMLLQEERSKVPVYGRYIRATIRNLMSKPSLGYRPRLGMGRVEQVLTLECARDWYLHLRSLRARAHPPAAWGAPIRKEPLDLRIPLGYHSQEELPYVPMKDRPLDIFFSGELRHTIPKTNPYYWLSTSKIQARAQLLRELVKLQQQGEWKIDFGSIAASDSKSHPQAFASYSEKLMNSRLCVAPRGTLPDTYRHFEGLRAGCLLVSNPLPVEPYLHDAPMIVVDHWAELGGILKRCARNLDALQDMSDRSLAWWNTHLKPEIVGQYIAAALNKG